MNALPQGVFHVIIRHGAWCPLAYGEGSSCCCTPIAELVSEDDFIDVVQHDTRNRAQRRANAKRARREGTAG